MLHKEPWCKNTINFVSFPPWNKVINIYKNLWATSLLPRIILNWISLLRESNKKIKKKFHLQRKTKSTVFGMVGLTWSGKKRAYHLSAHSIRILCSLFCPHTVSSNLYKNRFQTWIIEQLNYLASTFLI